MNNFIPNSDYIGFFFVLSHVLLALVTGTDGRKET